ncbi:integrin subunit alpha 8 [Saguinus oedipus]|uniref:Integrin subunit alpha 8 n=1 Tax=Saguinus oedipus TaxID=9490 RepID=A0ABQ9V9E8_SAGOE|nr:integrin subunit alpha 8 [Saguinus oedipus]
MAEVQLDSLKQKGAIKRTLFLDNHQAHRVFPLVIKRQKSHQCQDFIVYLRDETEFRDKLSPINISLNYSLDESTFKEGLEVKPILNYYRENVVSEQAHILVDCGEDNLCVPDLKLSARPDKHQVIIGDENHLMLIINARNEGEGAYEAELFVMIPEEADYVGIERNNKRLHSGGGIGFRPLSCEYKMENVTRMVVCDLGNPMVSGTNYSLGLRFAVPRLEKTNMSINFDLQIRSSNKDNPDSNSVSVQINITAVAQVEIRGTIMNLAKNVNWYFGPNCNWGSRILVPFLFHGGLQVSVMTAGISADRASVSLGPALLSWVEGYAIVLPIHNWEPEEEPHKEEEVGPLVEHIYELHNIGPSTINDTILEVGWPFSARDEFLLYIFHIQTLGPLQCQTNPDINPQDLKLPGHSVSVRNGAVQSSRNTSTTSQDTAGHVTVKHTAGNHNMSGFSCESYSIEEKNCLEFKANENVATVHALYMPAASPEDTPELSAFLRNSTIPHLVRKRDVPVVEFHRQSPAKILLLWRPPWRMMVETSTLTFSPFQEHTVSVVSPCIDAGLRTGPAHLLSKRVNDTVNELITGTTNSFWSHLLKCSVNCTNIECLQISCAVGRLEGGESAVLKVRSRLWAHTFLQTLYYNHCTTDG